MPDIPNQTQISIINQFFPHDDQKIKLLDYLKKIKKVDGNNITLSFDEKEETISLGGLSQFTSYTDYVKRNKKATPLNEQTFKNIICLARLKELANLLAGTASAMNALEQTELKEIMVKNGEFIVNTKTKTFSNLSQYTPVKDWEKRKKSIIEVIALAKEKELLETQLSTRPSAAKEKELLKKQLLKTIQSSSEALATQKEHYEKIFYDLLELFRNALFTLIETQKENPLQHFQMLESLVINPFEELLDKLIIFYKQTNEKLNIIDIPNGYSDSFQDSVSSLKEKIQKDAKTTIMTHLDPTFRMLHDFILYSFNSKATIESLCGILKRTANTAKNTFLSSHFEEKIKLLNQIAIFLDESYSDIANAKKEKQRFLIFQISPDPEDLHENLEQSDIENLIENKLVITQIPPELQSLFLELLSLTIAQQIKEKELDKEKISLLQAEKKTKVETLEGKLADITELNKELTKKVNELLQLKPQLEAEQTQNQKLKQQCDLQESAITETKARIEELTTLNSQLANGNSDATQALENKRLELDQLRENLKEKEKEFEVLSTQKKKSDDALIGLQSDYVQLKREHDALKLNEKKLTEDSEGLHKRFTGVESQLKEQGLEVQRLQDENKKQQDQLTDAKQLRQNLSEKHKDEMQSLTEQHNNEREQQKNTLKGINAEKEALVKKQEQYLGIEETLKQAEKEKVRLQNQLEQSATQHAEQNATKDQTILDLKSQLNQIEEKIRIITEEKNKIELDKKAYEDQLERLQTNLDKTTSELQQVTSTNEALDKQITELAETKAELGRTKTALEGLQQATDKTIKQLQAEIEKLKQHPTPEILSSKQKELEQAQENLRILTEEKGELEKQLESVTTLNKTLEGKANELPLIQGQLKAEQTKNQELTQQCDLQESAITETKARIEELTTLNSQLANGNSDATQALENKRLELDQLRENLKEKEKEFEVLSTQKKKSDDALIGLQSDYVQLKREHDALKLNEKKLTEDSEGLHKRFTGVESQLKEQGLEVQRLQDENKKQQDQLTDAKQLRQNLSEKHKDEMQSLTEQHNNEREQQKNTLEEIQQQLTEKKEEVKNLAAERLRLTHQINEINAAKEALVKKQEKYLEIEEKLKQAEEEKIRLQTQLEQSATQHAEQNATKEQTILDLKSQLNQTEETIRIITKEKDKIEFNKEAHDKTLEDLKNRLESETSVNTLLSSEIAQLKTEIEKLKKPEVQENSTQTDPGLPESSSNKEDLDSGSQADQTGNPSDVNSHLPPVQLADSTNKRGIRMPLLPKEQAKQLLENPDFQEKLVSKLTAELSQHFLEKVSEALGSNPNKSLILALINDSSSRASQDLAARVKSQVTRSEGLQEELCELLTNDSSLANNNAVAAEKLSEALVANNANHTKFSSSLTSSIANLVKNAQIANQVITTLSTNREGLAAFIAKELQHIATQVANKAFPHTDWKNSEPFNSALRAKLIEISSNVIKYLVEKPNNFLQEIIIDASQADNYSQDAILRNAKEIIPALLKNTYYEATGSAPEESVVARVERIARDTAQRISAEDEQQNSRSPSPTSSAGSTSPKAVASVVTDGSSQQQRIPRYSPLANKENPFPTSGDEGSSYSASTESIPLQKLPLQPPPPSPQSTLAGNFDPPTPDSGNESGLDDDLSTTTAKKPLRQYNSFKPIGKQVNANPEALQEALQKLSQGEALSKFENEEAISQLQVLQYADIKKPEEVFLALQAVCSTKKEDVEDAEETDSYLTNFSKIHHQLRTEALENISGSYITLSEKESTLEAKLWLEEKLRRITQRTAVDIELTSAEKSELTKLIQKKYPLSNLASPAIAAKSLKELEAEIARLKQYELNLITQTYQEFFEIEHVLSYYPALIEERNADTVSESTDEGFEEQSELQRFKNDLNARLPKGHDLSEDEARRLIDVISKRIEPSFRKWGLFGAQLDSKLIKAIVADFNQIEGNNIANQVLVAKAINLLLEEYQLGRTLKAREEWETAIKKHHAAIKAVESLRTQARTRIILLENMHSTKERYTDEDAAREQERIEGIELEDGNVDKSSIGQPCPVYLPNACRVIDNDPTLDQQAPSFSASGNVFQRRDTLEKDQTVTYEQTTQDNSKQRWSITRRLNNALDYKTDSEGRWWSSTKREVAFTQMVDAVQSFKNSEIVHFNFGNCSNETQKKYRIFIRAYNDLAIGPLLYCQVNNKIQMKTEEIDKAKEIIKKQLNLHTEELDVNLQELSSVVEKADIRPSIRNRG